MVLGVSAMLSSRLLFYFFRDPEGPNLLIVTVLGSVLFLSSYVVHKILPYSIVGWMRLGFCIICQVLLVVALYFVMR